MKVCTDVIYWYNRSK